jgi:hypothetical protein
MRARRMMVKVNGDGRLSNEEILARVENLTRTAEGWQGMCPLHPSKSGLNLSITEKDGKLLMHCFAQGCHFEDILAALEGKVYTHAQVYRGRVFEYKNLSGDVVAVHKHKGPWYRPSGDKFIAKEPANRPPYNFPEVVEAIKQRQPIYGLEFYTRTAEKMTGRTITDKKDPARAAAKRATLGFLYGLGIPKYRENVFKDTRMSLSKTQASKDREVFRATFPRFYEWQKSYGNDGAWTTRSVLGWRRHVDAQRDNRTGKLKPKYTDRLNGPIQSTAGDILYLALAKLREDQDRYPEARFLMGVHDEIVLEAPTEQAEDVARWLKEIMVESFEEVIGPELGGPTSVEVGYGPNWGEQTEVKD